MWSLYVRCSHSHTQIGCIYTLIIKGFFLLLLQNDFAFVQISEERKKKDIQHNKRRREKKNADMCIVYYSSSLKNNFYWVFHISMWTTQLTVWLSKRIDADMDNFIYFLNPFDWTEMNWMSCVVKLFRCWINLYVCNGHVLVCIYLKEVKHQFRMFNFKKQKKKRRKKIIIMSTWMGVS